MTFKELEDELALEAQELREENPDDFGELEVLREGDEERRLEDEAED